MYGEYPDTRIVRKRLFSDIIGRLYRIEGGILVDYGYYDYLRTGGGSDVAKYLWYRHVTSNE